MNEYLRPIRVCILHSSDDFTAFIRAGLSTESIIIFSEDDNRCQRDKDNISTDCFLVEFIGDAPEIHDKIQTMRKQYPDVPIIGCTYSCSLLSQKVLLSYLDGFYCIDKTSSAWAINLELLIIKTTENRIKQKNFNKRFRFYRQVFKENPIPMALTHPDTGVFIVVNPAFLKTLGYTKEEVIGKSSTELQIFFDPTVRDSIIAEYDPDAPPRDKEIIIRRKNGELITGLFSVDTLLWDNKEVLLTTMIDITYLKEVELSLSTRTRCIQQVLSNVSEGIIVYDTELNYRVWNRFMETITGISENELLGKPSLNFIPELIGDDLQSHMKKALDGKTSTSQDVWYHIPKTGKSGWVSLIYTPYRNSEGTIIGVIASVRDISERKKAEDEIRSHKGLLRSIIDTVPVSIICFDEKGTILLANKNFSSSFGLIPEVIEGHSYENFCRDSRFERHLSLIKQALTGREVPFQEEMEFEHEKPKKRFLRGRYSPLRGTDGEINGVVAVIIDITDLKIAQASVELVNSKLNLLSSITRHDILNSLTGILGYLTYAEMEQSPERIGTYIKKAHQVAYLIQEQIEFTRDYQDLGVKEPLWQNAKETFLTAISSLKMGDITLNLDLDGFSIFADPLLERVIYNICDNALRYGGTITRITSYWYKNGTDAIWVIRDDGVGIPEPMKERIFRKGVGNNTGLGLFLTREILDITGLSIFETGKEGDGAMFEIRIPDGEWKTANQ